MSEVIATFCAMVYVPPPGVNTGAAAWGVLLALGPTSAAVRNFAVIGALENSSAPTSGAESRGWPSMSTVTNGYEPLPALMAGLPL